MGDADDRRDEERRDDPVPTPEESWQRHIRILDLLKQIRVARVRRPTDRPR